MKLPEVRFLEHLHSTFGCIFDIVAEAIIDNPHDESLKGGLLALGTATSPYPASHPSNATRQAPLAFSAYLGLVRISGLLGLQG
ncbi:uncharacterized protein AFUA_1G02520 [Aspergillus fumigatus Af293]|uniref:Uncharacterized protein n=2 Tax=Aspergillus fumigatus TaxID=746128 RepID=Q4WKG8_ASPFU|nr:hypothetical protein AFUA_1G02520 [Aspergillus fumigatus Af293]EAL87964.1 hypothetical protein AFUA_1G02520 [Aspergillus fumigatus Af293]EDP55595.1 hypothetical protein AFUB_002900 [Aspergillus fumigatus A1163]